MVIIIIILKNLNYYTTLRVLFVLFVYLYFISIFFYFFNRSLLIFPVPPTVNHYGNRIRSAIIFFIFSTSVGSFLIILICNENEKSSCPFLLARPTPLDILNVFERYPLPPPTVDCSILRRQTRHRAAETDRRFSR